MEKITVLIVDDSRVIRDILSSLLEESERIEVVGVAENPYDAREKIKQLNPDVLTLDIEMPKMDGITFLKNLMRLRPMPVVMLSTLTQKGADITLEALEIGAIDYIEKPKPTDIVKGADEFKAMLEDKIIQASSANVRKHLDQPLVNQALTPEQSSLKPIRYMSNHIIAIGASTGGTEAIGKFLMTMPENCPPIVITQHIPVHFSQRFATRLNKLCKIKVKQAQDGALLVPGVAYIAPGGQHLTFDLTHHKYTCVLEDSAKVNRHKPSVDVMFNSLLPIASKIQAVLLTGMGSDGAEGMKLLKEAGSTTIIQSKSSSLIWGMPGSAFRLDAHQHECHLADIPSLVLSNAQMTSI